MKTNKDAVKIESVTFDINGKEIDVIKRGKVVSIAHFPSVKKANAAFEFIKNLKAYHSAIDYLEKAAGGSKKSDGIMVVLTKKQWQVIQSALEAVKPTGGNSPESMLASVISDNTNIEYDVKLVQSMVTTVLEEAADCAN